MLSEAPNLDVIIPKMLSPPCLILSAVVLLQTSNLNGNINEHTRLLGPYDVTATSSIFCRSSRGSESEEIRPAHPKPSALRERNLHHIRHSTQ